VAVVALDGTTYAARHATATNDAITYARITWNANVIALWLTWHAAANGPTLADDARSALSISYSYAAAHATSNAITVVNATSATITTRVETSRSYLQEMAPDGRWSQERRCELPWRPHLGSQLKRLNLPQTHQAR
jgi:hypothetical protein